MSERTTVKPDAVRAVALRYRSPLTRSCRRVVSTLGRVILGGVLLAPIGVFGVPLDTLAGTSVSAATSPTGGRLTLDATLPAPWDTRTSLLPMARSRLVAATPLTLVAFVEINMNGTWDPYPATNETVAFLDGGSQLGTAPIVGVSSISTPEIVNLGKATLQLPAGLSAGTHVLTAQFAATPVTNASGSLPLTVTVDATDDWVDADSVRLAARTFFPVKDGYLDTVTATGRTYERLADVVTVIRNSSGRTMLNRHSGATGPGLLKVSWVPRTSSGTPYPAGSYSMTVSQVDAAGNVALTSLQFALSSRAVVWKTVGQTQNGNDYVTSDHSPFAFVSQDLSAYTNGVVIAGNVLDPEFAEVSYCYAAPKAVIYGAPSFDILSRPSGIGDAARVYFDDLPDAWSSTTSSLGVRTISAPGTKVIESDRVGCVTVRANGADTAVIDIAQVRFRLRYAVWKS